MATSTKAQSTPMANNWEDIDSVESVEKQTSKVKILNRSSQEKKDEPDVDQPSKLVLDTASVVMVSPEEQNRTQYVPESKVLIMKRPTQDGLSNAANKPKQPVKTLEQRQAEYKEARLRILGNAEPEEKKGSGGASSNSDDNSSPDAGMPAPQGAGGSSVAQGVQRGLITGPAARLQQQQQQQNKKQATPNGRQNNQSKRNFNNQQGSPPNQPPAPFANSQFNPCAPPFQHSSLTNGSSKNTNGSQQGVAASQHQAFTLAQPPPMTAAPSTVIMAQQFPHYSAGQPYHQPVMGSPYPHGMPPPAQPQYVAQGDMPTAAYMQQQGPNVYHHQQQQEQPFMPQQPPQQFFQPPMPHYQQMQHSLPFMQMAPPPMPPPQHNHQAPMPPQQHMHQRPMQQQYPPHMMSHQNFPPPMPQYVQRQLGPRTAFPPPPPPPPQQDCLPLTNGDSSTGPAAPPSPPQQKPVAAEPTPREKSPTTDSAPAATTTTDSAPAATTTTDSAPAATTTTTTTAATNGKGNKKGNKNKAAKGKAYSTTRNSYTIKQRPKENESVSWRVRPVEVVPDPTSLRDDSPPESKTNGVERPCKTENTTTQDRAGSPEANNSASTKKEATNNQKEDEDTGSSSPVMTVKAKKKTKRGKKKNSAATALTVAISTTTVAKSNCKFDNERIVRMPYGPDGTKGFHLVR